MAMDAPSTPSLAGPARRSRRLQYGNGAETPGRSSINGAGTAGHLTGATTAAGSPYARDAALAQTKRPALMRDPSSQTLNDAEGGGTGGGMRSARDTASTFASAKKDVNRQNRRKTIGPEGLFGRVRRGLGWLVGSSSSRTGGNEDQEDDNDDEQEELDDETGAHANGSGSDSRRRSLNGTSGRGDEESALDGHNSAASRAMSGRPAGQLAAGVPPPPAKRTLPDTSAAAGTASVTAGRRVYPTPSALGGATSIRSGIDEDEEDDSAVPKRLRTSHSTLNLPKTYSVPTNLSHASSGPSYNARSRSPLRNPSPTRPSTIFPSGTHGLPASSSSMLNGGRPPSVAGSIRRSVSPGLAPQYAVHARPDSSTSSTFGLTSQSPFRRTAFGAGPGSATGYGSGSSARSPEFSLTSLNIANGLARSPSVPRERLAIQQGSRLYPFQRSPSITGSMTAAGSRPTSALGLPSSFSLGTGLSGTKRGLSSMLSQAGSPPRISPVHGTYARQPSYAGSLGLPSPSSTDLAGEIPHRAKRQRMSVVWDPERGFVPSDADGKPVPLGDEAAGHEAPKNEAERILERLEGLRRPQIDGLRNRSPQRVNVPLPAAATPQSAASIFATRITASQSTPSLASHAISPHARRQRAMQEESLSQRDRARQEGGLGERMRRARVDRERQARSSKTDEHEEQTEEGGAERDDQHETEQDDELEELPQPPARRRTRQQTRELSVLSDDGNMQEDRDEDEGRTNLRRSTRNKGGKSATRDASAEPDNRGREPPPSARRPKSAKAPPRSAQTAPATSTKARKGGKTQQQSDNEDEGVDEDELERPASPEPPKATRRNKASSPKKAKSPPPKGAERAASPSTSGKGAAQSIEGVMQEDEKSARSGRATTAKKGANGFSAKDADEEDSDEGASASAQATTQAAKAPQVSPTGKQFPSSGSATPRSTNIEVQKLKLPSSVFANRFSFGRSTPNSPLLAAASNEITQSAGGSLALEPAPKPLQTAAPPSFSLPPAVSPAPVAASSGGTPVSKPPAFSFGPTAATAQVEPQAAASAPTKSAPQFDFSKPAPAEASAPKASATPLFSFKPPSEAAAAPASAAAAAAPPATKPAFTFGPPASSSSEASKPAAASAPTFSFGAPKANPAAPAEKPAAPSFSFGKPAEADKKDAPASTPSFSFGGPAKTSTPAAPVTPAAEAASNPFAAFKGAKRSAELSDAPAAKPAPASFSFGAPASSAPDAQATPSFSFGKPVEGAKEGTLPAKPSFSFGAAGSGASTNGFGGSTAQPATNISGPDSTSSAPLLTATGAPGGLSPSTQPAKPPSFSFGQPQPQQASGTPPASSTPAPAFTFGAPASAAPASKASNPFGGSAAPASTPSFSFGASVKPAQSTAAPASSTPSFSFGGGAQASSTPAPAFSFGQPAASPAASSAPVSNAFGAAPAPTPAAAPAFTFGAGGAASAPASKPAFSFGAAAPAANSPAPAFSFGAAASQQQGTGVPTPPGSSGGFGSGPSFTFGAPNPGPAPGSSSGPAFSFGSGAPTPAAQSPAAFTFGAQPAGPGSPGGSELFNLGAGGDTSPNKGRVIKGLRRKTGR